ncbi:MAG: hypothetical protein AB7F32_13895 [Victivallaceae bacterium]
MKKMMLLLITALAMVMLAGCENLQEKSFLLDGSVHGFKVTAGADATTGTPIPSLAAGWGSNLLLTFPMSKKGTFEYTKKAGSLFGQIFGIQVTDETTIRITSCDSKIVVTSKTDQTKEVTTEVGDGVVKVKVDSGPVVSTAVPASAK